MLDLKKINKKLLLGIVLVFTVLVWTAAYVLCSKSDPYQKAIEFSSTNHVVNEKLGKIKSSRLGLYSFRVSENMTYGSAEFTVVLSGEKKKGSIYFLLTKDSSTGWMVRRAVLNSGEENLSILENL
ncbi:MAG: cytochrome c oxidase assembly factor Coa1 family protein [Pseudobdellovibrio sp.]